METMQALIRRKPFRELPIEFLQAMATTFRLAEFPSGARLVEQDCRVKQAGFIVSGNADLFIRDYRGDVIRFDRLQDGDFFGLMAVLANGTSLVSAVCNHPTLCCLQNPDDFFSMVHAHSAIKDYMYRLALQRSVNAFRAISKPSIYGGFSPRHLDNAPRIIKRSLVMIEKKYMQNLRLEDVARENGMSRYHFSRVFKKKLGCSFKEYLNRRRIKSAKRLLAENEMTVSEACFLVGFNDRSYFSRVFRKLEGMSPSEYRKARKQADANAGSVVRVTGLQAYVPE